jgi:hypothetical protein
MIDANDMQIKSFDSNRSHKKVVRLFIFCAIVLIVCCGVFVLLYASNKTKPRVWQPNEIKVAFWAWNNETVNQKEVDAAIRQANASIIFLRAGQFDFEKEKIARIRAITGKFPRGIETHLVYNATPSLLTQFEKIDSQALVQEITQSFKKDCERAAKDGANIAGLQLDFDVPTRLLPRYGELLKNIRQSLQPNAKLSITGLPTWMDSIELTKTLEAVDFWTPQFYGSKIPDNINEQIPITSSEFVVQQTARARNLGKPFYAGLPAYGHAVLFSQEGKRLELRGDLNPSRVATDSNFELLDCKPFGKQKTKGSQITSEWRCIYRARYEGSIDGLNFRADDRLALDIPTASSLRETARSVREEAGPSLLGICIFRLPNDEDTTNLTLGQIASALSDRQTNDYTEVRLSKDTEETQSDNRLVITAENKGETSSRLGDGAFSLTVKFSTGSLSGYAAHDGLYSAEFLCADETQSKKSAPSPCSARRANLLRLRTRVWTRGSKAKVVLIFAQSAPNSVNITITMRADDGRTISQEQTIPLTKGGERK